MVGIVWRFNREQMNVPVPIARSHFLTPESPAISIAQIKTDPNITAAPGRQIFAASGAHRRR